MWRKIPSLLFTHKSIYQDLLINLNGRPIKQVKTSKFLGVNIDNRLSYNQHAMAVRKKLSCLKGLMYKMSTYMTPHVSRLLYFSTFYAHITYSLSVWGELIAII